MITGRLLSLCYKITSLLYKSHSISFHDNAVIIMYSHSNSSILHSIFSNLYYSASLVIMAKMLICLEVIGYTADVMDLLSVIDLTISELIIKFQLNENSYNYSLTS